MEDCENAIDQCERTQTEVFENAPTFINDFQKTGTLLTHLMDIFGCVFEILWIYVSGLFTPILY